MNWIYSKWWKYLCAGIMFYVIVGSFTIPLAPGIGKIEPIVFKADSTYTFTITTYKAHLTAPEASNLQLWFKNGGDYYLPIKTTVVNNNTILAQFGIPSSRRDSLKKSGFDIVANNDLDGTFALREGTDLLKTNAANIDSSLAGIQWQTEPGAHHLKRQFTAFPYREILYETIRNTFFHVPMWFVMTVMTLFAFYYSVRYLLSGNLQFDMYASRAVWVALLFGTCGYTTGMVWSKYTWFIGMGWGAAVQNMVFQDIKLAGALIGIACYAVYVLMRNSITNPVSRAKASAYYNFLAVVVFMFFIFVLPRLTDSLHPGNGGNPAFSKYDLDSTLRLFFYPAVIGWILLGLWILSILIRMELIKQKQQA